MNTNNQAHPQVHVFNTLPLNQFERTRDAGNAAISRPQVYCSSSATNLSILD